MKDFKVTTWLSLTVFKHSRFQPLPELRDCLTTTRVESVRHWIWGISANRGATVSFQSGGPSQAPHCTLRTGNFRFMPDSPACLPFPFQSFFDSPSLP